MRKYVFLIILILSISLASSLNIELDCPTTIQIQEEFECTVEVAQGEGTYDVKFDISKGSSSKARVWSEEIEEWRSGYYYLSEAIENEEKEEFKIKVEEEGDYEAVLKIRQNGGIDSYLFNIEVTTLPKNEQEEPKTLKKEEPKIVQKEKSLQEIKTSPEIKEKEKNEEKEKILITLNNPQELEAQKEQKIFESKNSKIMKTLPVAFLILIILIIPFHFWEKL